MNNSQRLENNRTFVNSFVKALNDNELLAFQALFGKTLDGMTPLWGIACLAIALIESANTTIEGLERFLYF